MSDDNVKKIVVSDLFVDIYTNFNVCSQVERMKTLSKKELYLLILVVLDKNTDETLENDPVIQHNLLPFEEYSDDIYNLSDDKDVVTELAELVEETGQYVKTTNIVDSNGNQLREPLNKAEVRDAKINIIEEDNNK